jgi:hypothetical protein
MQVKWYRSARAGWVYAVLAVLAWDVLCPDGEMLTDGFQRALRRHPAAAVLVLAAWAALTLHLFDLLPGWCRVKVLRDLRRALADRLDAFDPVDVFGIDD